MGLLLLLALSIGLGVAGVPEELDAGLSPALSADPVPFPPSVPPPVAPVWPLVERIPLGPGVELWWLPRPDLPLVHLEILLLPSLDPATELVQRLAGALLDDGTRLTGARELELRADLAGARLSNGADPLGAWAAMDLPLAHLEEGLDLLAEVVFHPSFPRRELRRLRRRWLRSWRLASRSPSRALALAERRAVYPSGHPLGELPTRGDYRALTRRALLRQHQSWMRQARVVVILAGDGEPDAVAARLVPHLPADRLVDPPSVVIPPPPLPEQPRLVLMDDPGASQSRLVVSLPAPAVGARGWPEALLTSQVLGGDFTSRLNQRLREELGWTYGVYSELQTWPGHSRLRITATLDPQRTAESMVELRQILLSMGEIPQRELERARAGLYRQAADQLSTLSRASQQLVRAAAMGLAPTWPRETLASLAGVQRGALESWAARICDPRRATWILLADRERVEPQLEAAGLVPTDIWSGPR